MPYNIANVGHDHACIFMTHVSEMHSLYNRMKVAVRIFPHRRFIYTHAHFNQQKVYEASSPRIIGSLLHEIG